jgi:para-nitrobenzyl esterase
MELGILALSLALCSCGGGGTSGVGGAGGGGGGGGGGASGSGGSSSCTRARPSAPGEVLTTSGVVRGVVAGGTYRYEGIAYAAPPVASLRFAPPAAPACWDDVRDASAFGSLCPQWADKAQTTMVGAEDCLYLNVWTPASATSSSGLPVMVFIPGGGHQEGGASVEKAGTLIYDGEPLVASGQVVLVTLNYRVGPLGYLANAALAAEDQNHSTGNYGTLDQIAALHWVQDNIAAFGGDPQRVMVFGESAGGEAVCTLLASPLAVGLFAAAAIESGPCGTKSLADAESYGDSVVSAVGCAGAADVPGCLRGASLDSLMKTVPPSVIGGLPYNAVVDGHVLTDAPPKLIATGQYNHVPVIVGTNRDEMGINYPPGTISTEAGYHLAIAKVATTLADSFDSAITADDILAEYPSSEYASANDAFVALSTDLNFFCPARFDALALAAAQREPVYHYLFDHLPEPGDVHGSELPFVFGSKPSQSAQDAQVIALFAAYWSGSAATGNPNDTGLPDWPSITPTGATDILLTIDTAPQTVTDYRAEKCAFWASYGLVDGG